MPHCLHNVEIPGHGSQFYSHISQIKDIEQDQQFNKILSYRWSNQSLVFKASAQLSRLFQRVGLTSKIRMLERLFPYDGGISHFLWGVSLKSLLGILFPLCESLHLCSSLIVFTLGQFSVPPRVNSVNNWLDCAPPICGLYIPLEMYSGPLCNIGQIPDFSELQFLLWSKGAIIPTSYDSLWRYNWKCVKYLAWGLVACQHSESEISF